ncbi:MAG TPA: phosphatase PAP2 family protein [Polyangiaceae bacterium]|nr:phosphatase PAP2 family protein [Polyangiaceae bacterium]
MLVCLLSLTPRGAHAQAAPADDEPPTSPVEETPLPKPVERPLFAPDLPQPAKKPREVNALPLVSTNAPPPLIWKWPTFSAADFVVTGLGGAVTLTAAIMQPRPQHSLSGPIGADETIRKALRAHSQTARYDFRDASDVGLSLAVMWPFVADALTTAWWYRGSRETAQEMALIDLEALAIVGAIQGTTNVMVSRERPFGPDCGKGDLPADAIDCHDSFHYRSFFSGHSAFSFTGAALICAHHFENELLGSPWDGVSCAAGYAVAATTASFRVVADVHYPSDVLIGAAVGTLVGYGVPLLHYYQLGGSSRTSSRSQQSNRVLLSLTPSPGGLGVMGIF